MDCVGMGMRRHAVVKVLLAELPVVAGGKHPGFADRRADQPERGSRALPAGRHALGAAHRCGVEACPRPRHH